VFDVFRKRHGRTDLKPAKRKSWKFEE
jgi:hypothetical protein